MESEHAARARAQRESLINRAYVQGKTKLKLEEALDLISRFAGHRGLCSVDIADCSCGFGEAIEKLYAL